MSPTSEFFAGVSYRKFENKGEEEILLTIDR